MDIIRNTNEYIINYLGGYQRPKDYIKYKLSKYVFELDYNDVKILYNTLNGGICSLNKHEYKNIFNKDLFCGLWLYEHYFIVPEDFDEDYVLDEYRKKHKRLVTSNYLNNVSTFTIFTTLKCNARCFYCYELNMKGKKHMTLETADKVVEYILSCTCNNQTIKLDWFGGEPLTNIEVIEYIVTMLKNSNRSVTSSMTSNGYLFNIENINKMKDINLSNVQITLDGTEETYNKTKRFIYKDDPSPFKTVIYNIHNLLLNNIGVTIRLNVDNNNADDIEKLLYYLFKEFDNDKKNGKRISVYCFNIFEIGFERTKEQIIELNNKLIKFNQLIFENDFGFFNNDLFFGIKYENCMVDSGSNVTIDPDGNIGFCEHHFDKHLFSNVYTPEVKNIEEANYWQIKAEYGENCKDCKLKPICVKVPDCPSHRICRYNEKELQYNKISLGLITMYNNHKNNNNNCNCNGNNCCNQNVKCNCNCDSNF